MRRYYLVIPVEHIPTVKDLQWRTEDYSLVSHMLEVKQMPLCRDAPQSTWYRLQKYLSFLTSLNRWKSIKLLSRGSIGFLEADKLLEKLKHLPPVISKL
ncbi:hypothetical protein I3843_11G149500 [Carya illinoinensis]|nr:hypothetical protein I3843_11G149500 [Carya illinoinensis]KAG7956928.1 hypothetical protein I3843_11G149500 [Carya illinoinensis]KAG7956929.1 hypothetical protein I3843_11G149500 [Carya illinoinensis]